MPGQLLYEGKAKQIFATDRSDTVLVRYTNNATAFNGLRKSLFEGKGELNNRISALLFTFLAEAGIPTHFIREVSPIEQLVYKVNIIPIEVVVRNYVAGSLEKRLGQIEGTPLKHPVVEFYYKRDDLGDPLINEDHISILNLAEPRLVGQMRNLAIKINDLLKEKLFAMRILLVDFKLEFGVNDSGQLLLADEISPDTCRFWDAITGEKLDKDRFRKDLGQVMESYKEVFNRLEGKDGVQN